LATEGLPKVALFDTFKQSLRETLCNSMINNIIRLFLQSDSAEIDPFEHQRRYHERATVNNIIAGLNKIKP
jgi:hypothetical protein